MSNRALSFIGRLDRREESFVMNQLQEQEFLSRLLGNRDRRLVNNLTEGSGCAMCTPPPRATWMGRRR